MIIIEFKGLVVEYDGERNHVLMGNVKEYPIGGMIVEYSRLKPKDLKEIILSYNELDHKVSNEILADFFIWFSDKLEKKFGIVTATLVTIEFMDSIVDIQRGDKKYLDELFVEISKEDTVGQYIFRNTGYNKLGNSTNKQLLLTVYYLWSVSYAVFKHCFNILVNSEKFDDEQINNFLTMYYENLDYQKIDFHIAIFEGEFHSLYTIKSSLSLILFELVHCLEKNSPIKKCANCGKYFVPSGRIDTIYCDYISPQNPNKKCRDVGAQIARSNKEKNDIATREYRKIYMRYKMITIRHPENREAKKKFQYLTSEVKKWRNDMKNGTKTTKEFLNWLKTF